MLPPNASTRIDNCNHFHFIFNLLCALVELFLVLLEFVSRYDSPAIKTSYRIDDSYKYIDRSFLFVCFSQRGAQIRMGLIYLLEKRKMFMIHQIFLKSRDGASPPYKKVVSNESKLTTKFSQIFFASAKLVLGNLLSIGFIIPAVSVNV